MSKTTSPIFSRWPHILLCIFVQYINNNNYGKTKEHSVLSINLVEAIKKISVFIKFQNTGFAVKYTTEKVRVQK